MPHHHPRMTTSICATNGLTAAVRLLLASLSLVLFSLLPRAAAAITITEAKGYLNVTTFHPAIAPKSAETDATRTQRTIQINEALQYAYNNNVALYFPSGVYEVNNTLNAHTVTGGTGGSSFAVPTNHLVMIGSTLGVRPTIKLVRTSDFGTPTPVLDFRNFDDDDNNPNTPLVPKASEGYFQMLRGIDIDCSGYPNAIGVYFDQAQNSSVENVKVVATGAHTGFLELPSRAWGAVNIEVVGGQYGVETTGGNAGTVIAGAIFRDQTVTAVKHRGFGPMVIVGFEIHTPASGPQPVKPAITVEASSDSNNCLISLIDGSIATGRDPVEAAIYNPGGTSIYIRNVYVTGTDKLVSTPTESTLVRTGTWKVINEYSYCDQSPKDADNQITEVLVNGAKSQEPPPPSATTISGEPPGDLVSRHRWAALPSVDDPDAVDVTTLGITPGTVSLTALQSAIDNNRKLFFPKGIYRLTGTIKLGSDTILFGAARSLTRIEVEDTAWQPTSEVPVIDTVIDANGSTYLGDLTIGTFVGIQHDPNVATAHDYFTALRWRVGRNSMVHIGQPYRLPVTGGASATNPHSLIKIDGPGGGGRWYFAGAIRTGYCIHPDYRILKVSGTVEPLWIYGLNPEHALGSDVYCEFIGAKKVRIYAGKSEFQNATPPNSLRGDSVLVRFSNADNVAKFGHGAIRNAVIGHGHLEFINSTNVLAALIAPQNNKDDVGLNPNWHTLRETASIGVEYPNVVALYKRGAINDGVMVHDDPFYGPEMVFASNGSSDGWVRESSETANVGGSLLSNGTGAQALSVGDSASKQQYKSILSFDTSNLPLSSEAVLVGATLELRRGFSSGNINSLGTLRADIRTGSFGTSALENSDFQAVATAINVIPNFPIPAANGNLAVGALASTGRAAINRSGLTQLRVYFSSDDNNNGSSDLLGFYSGETTTEDNRPLLRVQFRQP